MTSPYRLDPLSSQGSPAELDNSRSPAPSARKRSAAPLEAAERGAGDRKADNETRRQPRASQVADAPELWPINTPPVAELAEEIAARVVEFLEQRDRRPTAGLVTAKEVAERLAVRKSWVYANKQRLGAIRLGSGPRARLRFDLETASRAIREDRGAPPPESHRRSRRRRASDLPPGVELIQGRRSAVEG